MYEYEVGDLVILNNQISYLARKYQYLDDNCKLFLNFENLENNDLFVIIKKLDNFSSNSITVFSTKKGFILEAYPHIFIKVS